MAEAMGLDERYESYFESEEKTCRCCGKEGLHWEPRDGKWRLFDGGKMHECPVNPLREE
jgi:hypothetical protein